MTEHSHELSLVWGKSCRHGRQGWLQTVQVPWGLGCLVLQQTAFLLLPKASNQSRNQEAIWMLHVGHPWSGWTTTCGSIFSSGHQRALWTWRASSRTVSLQWTGCPGQCANHWRMAVKVDKAKLFHLDLCLHCKVWCTSVVEWQHSQEKCMSAAWWWPTLVQLSWLWSVPFWTSCSHTCGWQWWLLSAEWRGRRERQTGEEPSRTHPCHWTNTL